MMDEVMLKNLQAVYDAIVNQAVTELSVTVGGFKVTCSKALGVGRNGIVLQIEDLKKPVPQEGSTIKTDKDFNLDNAPGSP